MATMIDPTQIEPAVAAVPTCVLCKVPFCDYCRMCENASCMLMGRSATSKADLIELRHMLATTQKARGYVVISEKLNVPKPFRVITDFDDIAAVVRTMPIPAEGLFVRPCPVRPRHGFVESRPLKSRYSSEVAAEVHSIFTEARAADPLAELLIVPTIKATHNIILTPTRLAVGTGNDGATAGKQSTAFPLAGVQFKELPEDIVTRAGVDTKTEDPYVEVVLTSQHFKAYSAYDPVDLNSLVYFTQLRAGVRIPPAIDRDFVPDRMIVDKVVEASGDLLEWERQVKEEIKPGTAVYHLGGTLISHYGVHCIYNNIPIFTSRVPAVGEELIPTARPERPTADSIIRGLAMGAGEYIGLRLQGGKGLTERPLDLTCAQATTFLLVASHNAAAMGGDNGHWLGLAAALMMRLGMAASHGEARHKDDYEKQNRAYVYKLALNDFFGARENLGYAQWRFQNANWSGGYGGKKWAACTDSVFRLDKAARAVIVDKSDTAVTELVTALHNAINQAHNGGWWLNKFVKSDVFDAACAQSMYTLSLAAPTILAVTNLQPTPEDLEKIIEEWGTAPEPEIAKGKTVVDAIGNDPNAAVGVNYSDTQSEDSDLDDSDDPDYDDANDDDGKCGNHSCTGCYPENFVKGVGDTPEPLEPGVNNKTGTAVPLGAVVTEAQFRLVANDTIHIQYKMDKVDGYQSFNAPIGKLSKEKCLELIAGGTSFSWAGSGSRYYPMTFAMQGEPGNWIFTYAPESFYVTHYCGGDK